MFVLGIQGFDAGWEGGGGVLVGESMGAGERMLGLGEKERRVSGGGGDRARLVSGDWSW